MIKTQKITTKDVLLAMIKAHEIQAVIALEYIFNRVELDHVVLIKVMTTAADTCLSEGDKEKVCNTLSLAWMDGQYLRTYIDTPL
ncbi:MAG: MmgE/PrpD family protein [Coxiella endosymbiont of Haemaphysalis japonica]